MILRLGNNPAFQTYFIFSHFQQITESKSTNNIYLLNPIHINRDWNKFIVSLA